MAHAPEVTGFTVHRHDDLPSIPRTKVYVMFVDFNERSVILEDPRKGLGDLRLLTMRQLWSLGGDAMLVYCGDVGSRHLKGNDLFNRDLTSIYHHQELSRLKTQERMFSMHDRFTTYQENHIRNIIFTNCC
ncbi:uncharacterized protein LOC121386596 [Gigantopelta aegis]|uniref:uncharacterized protein LOC121386596 n=1 Tax=Gigantopelta aegis TaxID=1735272 RepID=UPI001B889816|nr:uncharacterized protein LOC121386596 [Gigantopelta aegis]